MDILFTLFTFVAASCVFLFLASSLLILSCFAGKSLRDPKYPPVKGAAVGQLFYFNRLHDYFAEFAKTYTTFRLVAPGHSELYTADTRNIEYILKSQFEYYPKGQYNQNILADLFSQGIFSIDGDKWKQQRKLASYEFSTRVLREFSCSVFRSNSAKLVEVISEFSHAGLAFDMQDILMRCTLDSIFKVGFGVESNCSEGSSKEPSAFVKAFDDSNALVYWRYIDPSWQLKRFLNFGSEATLKKNIRLIDDFMHEVIKTRRDQLAVQQDSVSSITSIASSESCFSYLPV